MENHKVILVDDHTLFRNGLKLILNSYNGISIAFEASNGEEFIQKLTAYNGEIVLMDIDMPVLNGIEATRLAVSRFPEKCMIVN
jgi:DNA-binding NarL/FixJ family response regulator